MERKSKRTRKDTDRRGFLRTLGVGALGVGLGAEALTKLTGCGDTYHITNNYGPDGGAKPDSKADSMLPDTVAPDACVAKETPLQCSDTSVLAAGVLNQGEHFNIGSFRLVLDDLEPHGDITSAIVSITDSCGIVLKKDKLSKDMTKTFMINGEEFQVTVEDLAAGYTFGAKWADFTIKAPCSKTYWCPSVGGILNQGEHLAIDNLKIQLDDVQPVGSGGYALISIMDKNDNVLSKLKIIEKTAAEIGGPGTKRYKISVPTVAGGYTFGAKWADVQVSTGFSDPCA